jgi:hypothetical protein
VITTGFDQLFALMDGGTVAPGETLVGLDFAPEPGKAVLLLSGGLALLLLARRRRRVAVER